MKILEDVKLTHEQSLLHHLKIIIKDDDAVQMCVCLFKISQMWDDMHDCDRVNNDKLSNVIRMTLIDLPDNPFYDKFRFQLRPLIMSTILQWETANAMEYENKSPEKSYMLRAGIYGIFHMCVYLLYGADEARKSGDFIYSIYVETLDNFLKGNDDA